MNTGLLLLSALESISLYNLILLLIALVILWVVVSIPVYFGAKVVTKGKSTIGEAMVATLMGPIAFVLIYLIVDYFLGNITGARSAAALGWVLAIIAWFAVYKGVFQTGWLGAVAIAILSAVIYIALDVLVYNLFAVTFPGANLLPIRPSQLLHALRGLLG